jgi:hypothetical protein
MWQQEKKHWKSHNKFPRPFCVDGNISPVTRPKNVINAADPRSREK